jgi:hypothetical protein
MKAVLACVGAFGLLMVAAPVHHMTTSPAAVVVVPSWLNLPVTGELASVEYTGSIGAEYSSGTVTFELGEDAGRQLSAMKARLAANGFVIEEKLTSVDRFMGASSFAVAQQPISGQELRMVLLDTPAGGLLRVTFSEDAALFASAD